MYKAKLSTATEIIEKMPSEGECVGEGVTHLSAFEPTLLTSTSPLLGWLFSAVYTLTQHSVLHTSHTIVRGYSPL